MWRNEYRTCACGNTFKPRREAQRHCSAKCGTKARVTQHRSRYKESDFTEVPEKPLQAPQTQSGGLSDGPTMVWLRDFHHGPTPGALQGDDYPIEYYPDGYPKLPPCLDRGRKSSTQGGGMTGWTDHFRNGARRSSPSLITSRASRSFNSFGNSIPTTFQRQLIGRRWIVNCSSRRPSGGRRP